MAAQQQVAAHEDEAGGRVEGRRGTPVDSRHVDWRAVKNLLSVAYVLTAPDTLRRQPAQGTAALAADLGVRRTLRPAGPL